jgi:hypothetical protein
MTVDVPAIGARLARWTPRRLVSALLGLLAGGLGDMWVYDSVRFAVTGALPAGSALVEPDLAVHLGIALDLALLVPAYAVAAVLLWRGTAAGFVLASVLLTSGSLHQVGYMVALPFQAAAGRARCGCLRFDGARHRRAVRHGHRPGGVGSRTGEACVIAGTAISCSCGRPAMSPPTATDHPVVRSEVIVRPTVTWAAVDVVGVLVAFAGVGLRYMRG